MATCYVSGLNDGSVASTEYCDAGNTGNFVFWEAIRRLIECDTLDYAALRNAGGDQYDTFISSDLIWITPGSQPNPDVMELVEGLRPHQKLVPLSVGLQSDSYVSRFEFSKQWLDLLRRIGERASLACRGYFTQEMLHREGIRNTEVIGCPSVFVNKEAGFPLRKRLRGGDPLKAVGYLSLYPTPRNELSKLVQIIRYFVDHRIPFIDQTHYSFEEVIRPHSVPSELLRHVSEDRMIFRNVRLWREYLETRSLAVGTRFHGNIVAMMAGTPALFFSTDSRVREMCEYLGLPFLEQNTFQPDLDPWDYYDLADFTRFQLHYREKFFRFRNYCETNGVKLR